MKTVLDYLVLIRASDIFPTGIPPEPQTKILLSNI